MFTIPFFAGRRKQAGHETSWEEGSAVCIIVLHPTPSCKMSAPSWSKQFIFIQAYNRVGRYEEAISDCDTAIKVGAHTHILPSPPYTPTHTHAHTHPSLTHTHPLLPILQHTHVHTHTPPSHTHTLSSPPYTHTHTHPSPPLPPHTHTTCLYHPLTYHTLTA